MNAFYLNQGFQAYLAKPIHGSLLEATLLQFLPTELIERTYASDDEGEVLQVSAIRRKKAIAVTVDCPCDIPDEMLAAAGIVRMPFYIVTDSGRFRDVEEIDSDNLFALFEDGGVAHTTPGTVEEYEEFFGTALSKAETVIHITVESSVSKSYEIACQAADSFGNVYVVDSHQFASGMGLVALEAARLAETGMEVTDVVKATDAFTDQVQTTVLISSLDSPTIQKGMPAPLRMIVNALSLEPVFTLKRNGLRLHRFHGGYVTSAAAKYIKSAMRAARHSTKKDLMFVTYAGCSLQEQEEILALIEAENPGFKEIVLQKASATVAANTWMHSFGIMYVK